MNRLFTFGCSFTSWAWPTWADMIGSTHFDQHIQCGKHGAGQQYIAQTFLQAYVTQNINSNDTVIIMWTSCFRNDVFKDNEWITHGHRNFAVKWGDACKISEVYVRDMTYISFVKQVLDNIGCEYYFSCLSDYELGKVAFGMDNLPELDLKSILSLYKDMIGNFLPSMYSTITTDGTCRTLGPPDSEAKLRNYDKVHPLPSQHLEFIDKVLVKYPITRTSDREYIKSLDYIVLDHFESITMATPSFEEFANIFNTLFPSFSDMFNHSLFRNRLFFFCHPNHLNPRCDISKISLARSSRSI